MAKNLVLGPILAPLVQICALKFFFCGFYLHFMSNIVASYYCILFQEKLKNQTWENGKKKLILGLTLAHLAKFGLQFFFFIFKNLASSVTRYHSQLLSLHNIRKNWWFNLEKNLVTDGQMDGWEWFHRTLSDCQMSIEKVKKYNKMARTENLLFETNKYVIYNS